MDPKLIKLTTKTEEYYINPMLITSIKKEIDNNMVHIYTFDGRVISPIESLEEVMKKIKDSSKITLQF
jgi:hypothetical protein